MGEQGDMMYCHMAVTVTPWDVLILWVRGGIEIKRAVSVAHETPTAEHYHPVPRCVVLAQTHAHTHDAFVCMEMGRPSELSRRGVNNDGGQYSVNGQSGHMRQPSSQAARESQPSLSSVGIGLCAYQVTGQDIAMQCATCLR